MVVLQLLPFLLSSATAVPCGMEVVGMKTNNLVNPLGVPMDGKTKFSWGFIAPKEGKIQNVVQSAYRITVSSKSPAIGLDGDGDLWDSGVVKSSETIQIDYAGKPFAQSQLKYASTPCTFFFLSLSFLSSPFFIRFVKPTAPPLRCCADMPDIPFLFLKSVEISNPRTFFAHT